MAKTKSKKKGPKKRTKPAPDEIERRIHRTEIRSVFSQAGFTKVISVSDKEFTFKGRAGDVDDVFIYENIILLLEYTTSKSENISTHLLKKKVLFDHILNNQSEFVEFFENTFESFKIERDNYYDYSQCKVIILYCSKNDISSRHKDQVPNIKYFDYPILKYFKNVSDAVKLSSKYEIFKFLDLIHNDIGHYSIKNKASNEQIDGSVLPESYSNFERGYKVVSFYIDPESLLRKCYVLRKDGWRDEGGLYQRMIGKAKIKAIRKYLNTKKRVFINNIIVTLPSETKLVDDNGGIIDPSKLTKTKPVRIQIPDGFNVIGLIDGQHRVFAYHEGGEYESEISKLRSKQNLLVTGIIYPNAINEVERSKFEATLFLEINSTQTNAKSDLKQAIGLILNPFSSESIAKAVIHRLNSVGPLENKFEKFFFDKDKIKTTSVVSYGLKPIVKLSGVDSFYSYWRGHGKATLTDGNDLDVLNRYIDFCTDELNCFFVAVKLKLDKSKWTSDKSIANKVLSTSPINGLIICFRKIIENKKTGDQAYYENRLKNIDLFDFTLYKSSQYGKMGNDLYDQFFA